MKVNIDLELDLPEDYFSDMGKKEISQELFDEILNCAKNSHMDQYVDFVEKNKSESKHHKMWAKIIKESKMKVSIGEEN